MSEIRSLTGEARRPTYAERARLEQLSSGAIADVYCEPADAPAAFWNNVVQLVHRHVAGASGSVWRDWKSEFEFAHGLSPKKVAKVSDWFDAIVRSGPSYATWATTEARLSAIELVLEVGDPADDFEDRLNERARRHRVGVRLEDNRFVPITSELMHTEVVQPTLELLSQKGLEGVDGLYRKAFDRALSGDAAGATTASSSAVQELLRLGVSSKGANMLELANRAKSDGWIIEAVRQFAVKLDSLREESDAHAPGTDDFEVAMLAIHLAGSLLLNLGHSGPFAA